MEVLSEHLCQGWLEGYLLTGRHGLFNCYEAFIHIVDSMFNQHAKWLEVDPSDPVAGADRVAQLPALEPRLAPGPQRLLAPGSRLHRPRRQQEGGDRPRLPAAGRQLPAVGRRPLPAQPRLRQRDRRRQAAGAQLPRPWTRRSPTAPAGLGIWEWASQRRRRRTRRRARVRGRRPDARDRRGRVDPAPAAPGSARPGRQRRRPDAARSPTASIPTACPTASSTRCSRPSKPGDLRLPRLPVADPPPHLQSRQPRQHPRARLQGRGHDDDPVRHGDAQRPRPLPPRDRRDRPGSRARRAGGTLRQDMVDARLRAACTRASSATTRPRSATGRGPSSGLMGELGIGLAVHGTGRQRGLEQPEAVTARRGRRPDRRAGAGDPRRPRSIPLRWPTRSARAAFGPPTRSVTGSSTAASDFARRCASMPGSAESSAD